MALNKNNFTSINQNKLYKQMLKDRGVLSIQQFRTKYFNKVDLSKYKTQTYIWKKDDKLIKLSNLYYGSQKYWWIIGYYNQKPTDSHFTIGDTILIPPLGLYDVL